MDEIFAIIFNIRKLIERSFPSILLLIRRWRFGSPYRKIPLSKQKFAIVDPDDYDRLIKHKWYAQKSSAGFYAARSLTNGKKEKRKNAHMHHLVIHIPPGMFCDHINRNGLDNRKANLRPATNAQNMWNRPKLRKYPASRYKGVDWVRKQKSWRARISVNGRRIYIGSFKNQIDSAKAYDRSAKKYHGEFAVLNF